MANYLISFRYCTLSLTRSSQAYHVVMVFIHALVSHFVSCIQFQKSGMAHVINLSSKPYQIQVQFKDLSESNNNGRVYKCYILNCEWIICRPLLHYGSKIYK